MTIPVHFSTPETVTPPDRDIEAKIELAVQLMSRQESTEFESVNIIWVDDPYLASLHETYLDDPTETDVMTFNLADEGAPIEAEIYISLDRAAEQAQTYHVALDHELSRLAIHGCLHLCGFNDRSDRQRNQMRAKENEYLNAVGYSA